MKKYLIFFVINLTGLMVGAQNETIHLNQIDDQVWKPFMESFRKRNDTTFRSIHSREVARISIDDNSIIDYKEYFKKLPDSTLAKYKAWKSSIEIRHFNPNRAIDFLLQAKMPSNTGTSRPYYMSFISDGLPFISSP